LKGRIDSKARQQTKVARRLFGRIGVAIEIRAVRRHGRAQPCIVARRSEKQA